jgi:hypothetical protein
MQFDDTLLKLDRVPTDEEFKTFFKAHDFTTSGPLIDRENITPEEAQFRDRIRNLFQEKWLEWMKQLGGKARFTNFTDDYPVKLLSDTNAKLISDAILKIIADDTLRDGYLDAGFRIIEEPFAKECEKYMKETGKAKDDLTAEELAPLFDRVADAFLMQMVGRLITAQSVPEILNLVTENAAHEDFNSNVRKNFSEIDFKRKWEQDYKNLGEKLSFEHLTEEDMAGLQAKDPFVPPMSEKEIEQLKEKFIATLPEQDKKLLFLRREKKLKQNKIAERLGLKTQGAVSKRLKHLREQAQSFIKQELPDE